MINYGKHYIDEEDIKEVTKVLKSEFLTTGPVIEQFENQLTNYTGYKYAIVVNSGTAALHAALFAAGVGPGDEVIVPALTFIATANAVLYLGAKPVFSDIDQDTLLIDIDNVKKLINSNTKAIIAVDFAGQQADYTSLRLICDNHSLILISDACHSLGKINYIALNQIPDYVCLSFHPVKHITTGEGGAVLTKYSYFAKKIRAFINHGRYDGIAFHVGYNYRMSDIQAALGMSQLKKLNKFIIRRNEIAAIYEKELNYCSLKKVNQLEKGYSFLKNNEIMRHVYHLYVIKLSGNRDFFIQQMKENGIQCTVHYMPVYNHILYDKWLDESEKNCKNTELIKDKIVSLPIYYSLTDEYVNKVITLVKRFNPKKEGE